MSNLKELRINRGLTMDDLAEASGITKRTIWRIENGAEAWPGTWKRLADALEVTIAELRTREEAHHG